MASRLEQDLSCPIGLELFKDPVVVCSTHLEELCLFCLDHQDLVCQVCTDCRTHTDHSFILIEEAAQGLREQLRNSIKPLQDKLKVLDQRRAQFDSAAAHITAQARQTQTQIKAQFDKLRQFLIEEEQSRMKTLREEEDRLTQRMKDKITAVSRDIETLSQTISETEEQLRASDMSFLLQYKTVAERVEHCPQVEEPELEPEALIDQTKHLGNLGFNIWRNMKSLVQFYPVLLDPNTAGPGLVLSEDLSSMRRGEDHELPENPERFRSSAVLGSEEFVSGTHSWDVEVGENKHWTVGMCGSVQRGEDIEGGLWCVCFTDGKYTAFSHSRLDKPLSVTNLQSVRVKLDFGSKTVTFTDPDTNTDLLTVTDTFTEGLTPYLVTIKDAPLKILPKDISITV